MTTRALPELFRQVAPLAPALSISDVADRFLDAEHRAFLSLPVVDEAGCRTGWSAATACRTSSCSASAAISGGAARPAT